MAVFCFVYLMQNENEMLVTAQCQLYTLELPVTCALG